MLASARMEKGLGTAKAALRPQVLPPHVVVVFEKYLLKGFAVKIDASLAPAGSPGLETAKRASRPQSPVTEGGGEVQLSLSGRLHSSLEADGAGQVDSNRVAAIKQAIAEGRFSINAGAIADRLISSAQELLAKQAKT